MSYSAWAAANVPGFVVSPFLTNPPMSSPTHIVAVNASVAVSRESMFYSYFMSYILLTLYILAFQQLYNASRDGTYPNSTLFGHMSSVQLDTRILTPHILSCLGVFDMCVSHILYMLL